MKIQSLSTHPHAESPSNISGASQQNSIAAFPETTEVDGDLF